MDITPATREDVPGIRSVAETSWEADYPGTISRETVTEGLDDWYGVDRLREALADPKTTVLVARVDGQVVGFTHAIVTGETGTILRLYVDPDYRRRGIGRALFERSRDALESYDVGRIRGMVLADNDPGNEFYRQLGFERVSTGETLIGGESFEEHTYELTGN